MNYRTVFSYLGILLVFLGALMALPMLIALIYGQSDAKSFALSGGICIVCGLVLKGKRNNTELSTLDAFSIVTFGWLTLATFSTLPLLLSGACTSFVDALFETMSGLTTTGASIIRDIDGLSKGVAFWRCFLQWLGGMGFIVLSVAILPKVGVGGMNLFKAESPGPTPERLTPKIQQTAKTLWQIYLGLSIILVILLMFTGLNLFDAVVHTMATMSTGGFSNYTASVGRFNNLSTEIVLMIFMFLAGCNFTLHYHAFTGRNLKEVLRDVEFKVFFWIVAVATILVTINLYGSGVNNLFESLRQAGFQVVSIITTTGFATQDFNQWPVFSSMILLLLMFIGGCAGSTSGSVKVIRYIIAFKHGLREFLRLIHPRSVHPVRVGNTIIEERVISSVLGFIFLFFLLWVVGILLLLLEGLDFITAISAVATSIANVGPGLGLVGPNGSFVFLSPFAKVILSVLMLIGRLELYSVLVLFIPSTWSRGQRNE